MTNELDLEVVELGAASEETKGPEGKFNEDGVILQP